MGRKHVDPNETPNARFRRLMKSRLEKFDTIMGHISNLVGPNYKSSREERMDVAKYMRGRIDKAESILSGEKNVDEDTFEFSAPLDDDSDGTK